MKTFGIMQAAFPPRSAVQPNKSYVPDQVWRMFHSAGRKYGLKVVFFQAEDVDFRNRRVHAWSSQSEDGRRGWLRQWHPLPDVLYENYPTSRKRKFALAVKRRFARRGVPVFNPAFLNKADLHSLLNRSRRIRRFLPASIRVTRSSAVTKFLSKYGYIYLKPVKGTQGKGIVEVSRLSRRRIRIRSDHFARNRSLRRTMSSSQFQSFVRRLLHNRKYLVQQGLRLVRKGRRKIDFRVVVHRGIDGKWRSAGIRPKLGRAGSMVTNLHAGGSKTTWPKLKRWAQRSGRPMPPASKLEKPALMSARYLMKYRRNLSHLGIDIGIDRRKRVYLLDFNIVPGRRLLTPGMLRRVTDMTAGFARYLTRS